MRLTDAIPSLTMDEIKYLPVETVDAIVRASEIRELSHFKQMAIVLRDANSKESHVFQELHNQETRLRLFHNRDAADIIDTAGSVFGSVVPAFDEAHYFDVIKEESNAT